ncbi:DedA family protein [Phytoactinopolyspora halotolerans]|uniref:DedA family protein n=1 Tax=Phytoactinopolyspora halotolerans TaxID=1981512 RepID=A0A6L9SFL2_9ACTN|nr:DedA family protein [Phytoactinopolyspora halotolerans]NEE04026.1 DedA family protein [Phytoactinopolyspora halotolerans]
MLEALGDFGDTVLEHAENAMSSPWIYVLIFGLAFLDAFFPVVPSETLVITAGVFAASGDPALLVVIVSAAAGAFVGDHTSYLIGRTAGVRVRRRFLGGKRAGAAFTWASNALTQRGGLILVVARYIPGGRTAVTLTCGTLNYPLRKFSFFDMFAAISWGIYSGLIGYFGGRAFEDDPLRGLLLGLGIALGITVIVEIVRHVINRRRGPVSLFEEDNDDGGSGDAGAEEVEVDEAEVAEEAARLAEDPTETR